MKAYAGTIDRVAEINGAIWILDIKTGKRTTKQHCLQGAAYSAAYEYRHGCLVKGFGCVYLHPQRKVRGKHYTVHSHSGRDAAPWRDRWADLTEDMNEGHIPAGVTKTLAFDEETHAYTLGGHPIPSVTQLIDSYITKTPYTGDPSYGIRGTRIHLATQFLDENDIDDDTRYHPEYVEWLDAWENFKEDHKPDFLAIEQKIWATVDVK